MTSFLAATFLLIIFLGVWVLLERTNRRTAGLPRMPFGADADRDVDFWRVRHDLDAARPAPLRRR